MSVRGRVLRSTPVGTRAEPASGVLAPRRERAGRLTWPAGRTGLSRISGHAWGAIGATATFIALTCWWLSVDASVPVFDAGEHLEEALIFHDLIKSGDLLGPITFTTVYPPLGHIVGALAAFIGGVNVNAPIIGENLVFVTLLALGCYQTARLLFGSLAGLLSVIFVLGSPLLIVQFHVFMLDAPEAAMAAISIWLILASENFSRTRVSALAGLVVGGGLLIKLQFPLFIVGIALVALARGGWRNWRGVVLFGVVAVAIASPWYLSHLSEFSRAAQIAGVDPNAAASAVPPVGSVANLTWYFWSTLNSQLFAGLFLLALIGAVWLVVVVARGHEPRAARLEFLLGMFIAWLGVTVVRHHDIRYDIPLMPYLAVIGTGWIAYMSRPVRLAAIALLSVAVLANTLASTFGVGGKTQLAFTQPLPDTQAYPDRVVFLNNEGFLVAGPHRDGDVPGLLDALYADGIRTISWNTQRSVVPELSNEGLASLAYIARLTITRFEPATLTSEPGAAALIYEPASNGSEIGSSPCTRMRSGAGVWVIHAEPSTGKLRYYCPTPRPHYYGAVKLN